MDVRKIVVVVEDVDAARTALEWALHNITRFGDIITLLHVYPSTRSRSKKKARLLRLKGFQLALSFQHICNNFPNTKVEIIITEGDQEGGKISSMVREIGASMLVVGLHDHSFLYKLAMAHSNIASSFNCRVLAIKQPHASPFRSMLSAEAVLDSSTNMDFTQIDLSRLQNVLQSASNSSAENPIQNLPQPICNYLEIKEVKKKVKVMTWELPSTSHLEADFESVSFRFFFSKKKLLNMVHGEKECYPQLGPFFFFFSFKIYGYLPYIGKKRAIDIE